MPVFPLSSQLTLFWPAPRRTTSSRATLCGFLYHHEESRGKWAKVCFIAHDHSSAEGSRWNSLSREQTEGQTHRISNFEIPTLPEPGIGQPILACGSEGQANVLRAVPDCELHLGPNTLETQWESTPSTPKDTRVSSALPSSPGVSRGWVGHLCTYMKKNHPCTHIDIWVWFNQPRRLLMITARFTESCPPPLQVAYAL